MPSNPRLCLPRYLEKRTRTFMGLDGLLDLLLLSAIALLVPLALCELLQLRGQYAQLMTNANRLGSHFVRNT